MHVKVIYFVILREATPLVPRGFGAPRFLEKSQDKFLGMTSPAQLLRHQLSYDVIVPLLGHQLSYDVSSPIK